MEAVFKVVVRGYNGLISAGAPWAWVYEYIPGERLDSPDRPVLAFDSAQNAFQFLHNDQMEVWLAETTKAHLVDQLAHSLSNWWSYPSVDDAIAWWSNFDRRNAGQIQDGNMAAPTGTVACADIKLIARVNSIQEAEALQDRYLGGLDTQESF